MKKHLKIWIPAILSFLAYIIAKGLEINPGPRVEVQPTFWYVIWGILQIVAAYGAWEYLKFKNRSGGWVGLVAVLGIVGIIIIYLIPAKKVVAPPLN